MAPMTVDAPLVGPGGYQWDIREIPMTIHGAAVRIFRGDPPPLVQQSSVYIIGEHEETASTELHGSS